MKIWDYKNADINKIHESRPQVNWDRHLSHKYPDEQIKFLNDCILNVFNNYYPVKL